MTITEIADYNSENLAKYGIFAPKNGLGLDEYGGKGYGIRSWLDLKAEDWNE